MTVFETASTQPKPPVLTERRSETRVPACCDLWMVDHDGSTVLQCHCLDTSKSGMRLRVPLGYGVAEGQRYELRSHLPGEQPAVGFSVIGSRWATVVWTEVELGEDRDHLGIGVALDPVDSSLIWTGGQTNA